MELNLVWAALLGGVLAGLVDWLSTAFLFRKEHDAAGGAERVGGHGHVVPAFVVALISAAAFVALAWKVHQTDPRGAVKLAAMIWLIGPLPLLFRHAWAGESDARATAGHAAGWLIKLLLIAGATALLLP
jgi:hypothetical protein